MYHNKIELRAQQKKNTILDRTLHTTKRVYVSLEKKQKIYVDLVQLQNFI